MLGRFVGGPRVSDAPLQFVLFVCVYIYSGGGRSGGGSGRTRRDAPRNTNTSNTPPAAFPTTFLGIFAPAATTIHLPDPTPNYLANKTVHTQ